MKIASLFIPVLAVAMPIAPANAEKNRKVEDTYKCSTTTWPVVKMVTDKGWQASDAWWGAAIRVQKLTNPLNC
jgi:hypothetical protein